MSNSQSSQRPQTFISLLSWLLSLNSGAASRSEFPLSETTLQSTPIPPLTSLIYAPPPYTYDQHATYASLPDLARQVLVDNGVLPYNISSFTLAMVEKIQHAHLVDFGNSKAFKECEWRLVAWRKVYEEVGRRVGLASEYMLSVINNEEMQRLEAELERLEQWRKDVVTELKGHILPEWYAQLDAYVAGNDAIVWLQAQQLQGLSESDTGESLSSYREEMIHQAVKMFLFWADHVLIESRKLDAELAFQKRIAMSRLGPDASPSSAPGSPTPRSFSRSPTSSVEASPFFPDSHLLLSDVSSPLTSESEVDSEDDVDTEQREEGWGNVLGLGLGLDATASPVRFDPTELPTMKTGEMSPGEWDLVGCLGCDSATGGLSKRGHYRSGQTYSVDGDSFEEDETCASEAQSANWRGGLPSEDYQEISVRMAQGDCSTFPVPFSAPFWIRGFDRGLLYEEFQMARFSDDNN